MTNFNISDITKIDDMVWDIMCQIHAESKDLVSFDHSIASNLEVAQPDEEASYQMIADNTEMLFNYLNEH